MPDNRIEKKSKIFFFPYAKELLIKNKNVSYFPKKIILAENVAIQVQYEFALTRNEERFPVHFAVLKIEFDHTNKHYIEKIEFTGSITCKNESEIQSEIESALKNYYFFVIMEKIPRQINSSLHDNILNFENQLMDIKNLISFYQNIFNKDTLDIVFSNDIFFYLLNDILKNKIYEKMKFLLEVDTQTKDKLNIHSLIKTLGDFLSTTSANDLPLEYVKLESSFKNYINNSLKTYENKIKRRFISHSPNKSMSKYFLSMEDEKQKKIIFQEIYENIHNSELKYFLNALFLALDILQNWFQLQNPNQNAFFSLGNTMEELKNYNNIKNTFKVFSPHSVDLSLWIYNNQKMPPLLQNEIKSLFKNLMEKRIIN